MQEVSKLTGQLAAMKVERDDACQQLEASAELEQALDVPSCDQAHGFMGEVTACPYFAVMLICVPLPTCQTRQFKLLTWLLPCVKVLQSLLLPKSAFVSESVDVCMYVCMYVYMYAHRSRTNSWKM